MSALNRLILRDDQWARISPHIIGDERTRGSSGRDNRLFVEAVLWIVRTGSPWRDLPEVFGEWNSVFRRFSRWMRIPTIATTHSSRSRPPVPIDRDQCDAGARSAAGCSG